MVAFPDPGLSAPANRILLVLGQTPFPVELLDSECRVLYYNIAYARIFLGPGTSVLDQPTLAFPQMLADGSSREDVLRQAAVDGLWKGEVRVLTYEKDQLPVRLSVFPIQHPSDTRLEFAVFYEDIRKEVETREALAHHQNLVAIRSRQAQMGELLSMIAHQWRQPLTVVSSLVGNIQLKAEMGAVDPGYLKTKLDRLSQTVQFLSETIDSFRDFYMPARAKSEEDLGALIHRALGLLSPSLDALGFRVEVFVPKAAPKAWVYAGELLQVVLELIVNARDALHAAALADPVLKISVGHRGDQVFLVVGNSGPVIPPHVLPFIFDPYFTTKEGGLGTGLGLYMAKLIVESHHGGALTATSEANWTEFVCRLPREQR